MIIFGGKPFDLKHLIDYVYNVQGENGQCAITGIYEALEYFLF